MPKGGCAWHRMVSRTRRYRTRVARDLRCDKKTEQVAAELAPSPCPTMLATAKELSQDERAAVRPPIEFSSPAAFASSSWRRFASIWTRRFALSLLVCILMQPSHRSRRAGRPAR